MKEKREKFEYLKNCPICSYSSLKFFRKGTFDFAHLDEDQIKITDSRYGKIWNLAECQDCGHIFANPCPSPDFIFSLYSQIEDPLYEEEAQGRSKNFLRILSFLEKTKPQRGVLFDVGAATGILLNLARERGWEPEGVEASSWAVAVAEKKYRLRLEQGFFEKAHLRQNYYAALTMIDFLEHTPLPLQALAKAHEILAPSGILCLVTPDIHSLTAKVAGRWWWHFRPAHLAYFSPESLSTLLRRTHFRIFKKRRYSWTFSAHYLVSRWRLARFLLKAPGLASFLKRIPIKLALADSFEIYARKEKRD